MVADGAQVVLMARNDIASAPSDRPLQEGFQWAEKPLGQWWHSQPRCFVGQAEKPIANCHADTFLKNPGKVPLSLVGVTFFVFWSCWRDAVSPMYVWRKLLFLHFLCGFVFGGYFFQILLWKSTKNHSLRNHHLAFPTVRFPRKKPPGWRNICTLKKSTAGCLRKVDVLLMAWDLQPKDIKLGKWEYQVQEIYVFWRFVVIFGKF